MSFQMCLSSVLLCLLYLVPSQQQPPPIRLAPTVAESTSVTCQPFNANAHSELIRQGVQDYVDWHKSAQGRPCSCGGKGWTRVAYLDMNDTSHQCPYVWPYRTNPVRSCGHYGSGISGGCNSVTYPVHGLTYSQVCGRILAYQNGRLYAFSNAIQNNSYTVETPYLSGISLTRGPPGSRQHIWSFAMGITTSTPHWYYIRQQCPCRVSNYPYQLPSFIGNNYFCDSKISGYDFSGFYSDTPAWDGQSCASNNPCCHYHNPPWFCTSLPQPTNDNLEIRNCFSSRWHYEDTLINLIEIYVK